MLRSEGLGLMVWSPLAGGLLSGKYGRDQPGEPGSQRASFDFPPVNRELIESASCLPAECPGWMLERQGDVRRQQVLQAQAGRGTFDS